jgi:hypothetical protein
MASLNLESVSFLQDQAERPEQRLTTIENLAINMVYRVMRESRYNRSPDAYAAIAARLPHFKELHYRVNECLKDYLRDLKAQGHGSPEFCRFRAGDGRIVFETYPDSISGETIRSALIKHGFRVPRGAAKPLES